MNEGVNKDQLVENLRFYGNMRFKQLTLFVALLSLTTAGVGQYGEYTLFKSVKTKEVLAIAAMLFTGVLWIMEVRSSLYWVANREQVRNLWPSPSNVILGYLNASNAVLALYMSVFFFWVICVHFWVNRTCFTALCCFFGIILAFFSIGNYIKHLWSHKDSDN